MRVYIKKFLHSIPAYLLAAQFIFAGDARSETCKFAEWGHGYVKVLKGSEHLVYTIHVQGDEWQEEPYGYHAPGVLSCSQCLGSVASASGLYHFIPQGDAQKFGSKYPRTASQRVTRGEESFGYPPVGLRAGHLKVLEARGGLSVGPLSGYSVLYRVASLAAGADRIESEVEKKAFGLLVVSLTDHCVTFETSVLIDSHAEEILNGIHESFLASLGVVRTTESEAKIPESQPFTIRPRITGEEPIFQFNKNK